MKCQLGQRNRTHNLLHMKFLINFNGQHKVYFIYRCVVIE